MTTIFGERTQGCAALDATGCDCDWPVVLAENCGPVHECSDVPSALATGVIIASGLFAVALGLLQSLFDLRPDARAFLLHRPIAARRHLQGKAGGRICGSYAGVGDPFAAGCYLSGIHWAGAHFRHIVERDSVSHVLRGIVSVSSGGNVDGLS